MLPVRACLGAALAASLLSAWPAGAEAVPGWLTKFSVHGYLNQGYADSGDYPIHGIPTGGTSEYRDLALQFRYDPNPKNSAVVQFRHQQLGERSTAADGVALDWAFYQHRFTDRFSVKAGRVPLPLGIFNEAGGAATTSPFFRPTDEFYDRHYTSKTVDGALGSATFGSGKWSFDVDAYGGRWVLDQFDDVERADARNAWGGQVWANSPWEGVRFGGGAYRCEVEPSYGDTVDYLALHASVDADLDRWRFATEFFTGNLGTYGRYRTVYAQVGYDVTSRISVHARGTMARVRVGINGHSIEAPISKDLGLAVNYAIHPHVLFKLEGHSNEGLLREDVPRNLYAQPASTRYWIASVVATF